MKTPFGLKREEIIVVGVFLLMLLLVVGLAFWGSYEIRDLRNGVDSLRGDYQESGSRLPELTEPRLHTIIEKESGPQGKPGPQGPQGLRGESATDEQVTRAVEEYLLAHPVVGEKGDKGERGEKGDQGDRGAIIFQRINPLTLLEECRLPGDDGWQPMENCL